MEVDRKKRRVETDSIGTVINCVIPYIHDAGDRNSISLVCRKWCELDGITRKHVTVHMCYVITPFRLRQRFPNLESLTLKGKPRAPMFDPVPHNWGAYVAPWVHEFANSFNRLKSVHFKRMIVRDSDLELITKTRGNQLRVLMIDSCSGFTTDGLLHIGNYCNNLRNLCLQNSFIVERDGKWLHELALNNTAIESLNYYTTPLFKCDYKDLILIAKNCSQSLVSLKVTECDLRDLVDVFRFAINLKQFGGSPFVEEPAEPPVVMFPPKLTCMTIDYMSQQDIYVILPFAHQLTELDLLHVRHNADEHCILLSKCPNLEVLYTRDTIGDFGLQVLGCFCNNLRRIKIEKGVSEDGLLSDTGLIGLALGCLKLEYLHVYVKNIANEALKCIGGHLKNLYDFHIISLDKQEKTTYDIPLDNGVQALLTGCTKLERLGLYFPPGAITDVGLGYIGKYGQNIESLFLGYIGETDEGLVELSKGCPKLKKFEMRGCYIGEEAVAEFVLNATCLRYLWVQGHRVVVSVSDNDDYLENGVDIFGGGGDIMKMGRPFWNMELIKCKVDYDDEEQLGSFRVKPFCLLAYYSLAGQRTDLPDTVTPLLQPCD